MSNNNYFYHKGASDIEVRNEPTYKSNEQLMSFKTIKDNVTWRRDRPIIVVGVAVAILIAIVAIILAGIVKHEHFDCRKDMMLTPSSAKVTAKAQSSTDDRESDLKFLRERIENLEQFKNNVMNISNDLQKLAEKVDNNLQNLKDSSKIQSDKIHLMQDQINTLEQGQKGLQDSSVNQTINVQLATEKIKSIDKKQNEQYTEVKQQLLDLQAKLSSQEEILNKTKDLLPISDPMKCKSTYLGTDYRGNVARTDTGLTCMAWASQVPHRHTNTPQDKPNAGLESNYCRNPDNEPNGPWCYTTDRNTRWQYCSIPYCSDGAKNQERSAFSISLTKTFHQLDKGVILPFEKPITNLGSHFNLTTHKYTCPVTGFYFFSLSLCFDLSSNYDAEVTLMMDSSRIFDIASFSQRYQSTVREQASNSIIKLCNQGQQVWAQSDNERGRLLAQSETAHTILTGLFLYES